MAWGGLLSPFCGVLPVTVGALFPFPDVMTGAEHAPGGFAFSLSTPPLSAGEITTALLLPLFIRCARMHFGRKMRNAHCHHRLAGQKWVPVAVRLFFGNKSMQPTMQEHCLDQTIVGYFY